MQHIDAVKLTVERVLQEYACLVSLDISTAFDENGQLLPIHQIPEVTRRAIAGIEVAALNIDNDGMGSVGKLHKLKFYDKRAALADVAKHLGMFIDKVEHSGSLTISHREALARELDERRKNRLSAGPAAR